ncbi:GNAT family N-acetyltransferase [Kitasatospora sp. NPDC004531]
MIELGSGDAEALLRIYSAEATRHLGREAMDATEAHRYVRDAAAQVPRMLYVLGLTVDGNLVGVVKLHRDRPVAAVSYILRPDAWGRGYATEGVRRILALAFGRLGLPEVRAKHRPDNLSSGRVLRKASFATYAVRAPTPRDVAVEVHRWPATSRRSKARTTARSCPWTTWTTTTTKSLEERWVPPPPTRSPRTSCARTPRPACCSSKPQGTARGTCPAA